MESGVGCPWLAGETRDWGGREEQCGSSGSQRDGHGLVLESCSTLGDKVSLSL